jgi:hypothetical protein
MREHLETRYAVSPELASELSLSPEKALPKLLAQAHMNAMQDTLAAMQKMMPQAVDQTLTAKSDAQKAADEFFGVWPELKDAAHGQQVVNAINTYRAMNKSATREQIIRGGGMLALTALGLPIPARVLDGAPAAQTPSPSAQSLRTPASPGGASMPAPAKSDNVFTQMAEELLEDDK